MRNKLIVMLMVVAMVLVMSGVAAGLDTNDVKDNNNGNEGDILVNTGTTDGPGFLGNDIGTWVSPTDVPGLKGEDGKDGIDGRDGRDADVRRNPAGLGIDAILWQTSDENVGIETQYKYDIQNDEHSVYGVMKLNLWKMLKR